jgi:hypothetical protein
MWRQASTISLITQVLLANLVTIITIVLVSLQQDSVELRRIGKFFRFEGRDSIGLRTRLLDYIARVGSMPSWQVNRAR